MEIKLYFKMLQRSWWLVVLTALVAVAVALIAALFATPLYQASGRFIVSPNPALLSGGGSVIDSLATLDKRSIITTYAEILKSPRIYREALTTLGLTDADVEDYTFNAIVLPDTNIIEFSVRGPDPVRATMLVNSIGEQGVRYVSNLYQVYDMSLLDPAVVPTEPVSPQPLRSAAVALVVGLALGLALALSRELIRAPITQFMQQRELDEVSQALKRAAFEERLEDVAFASAKDFSLCIVHLDGLTEYVDVLPKSTMSTILQHVTQILKNQLRGNDLVGRWGDTDFAVLLSETRGDAATNTMERVRTALSIPIRLDVSGEDLALDPKIGIAEYRVGDTAESLVENTNWALEIAKKGSGLYLLRATEPI
jgi:diguanylate cyclase (GGDEF)-like protein